MPSATWSSSQAQGEDPDRLIAPLAADHLVRVAAERHIATLESPAFESGDSRGVVKSGEEALQWRA